MIDGLGERLKTALKKKKVTMNECAKALRIAKTTLSGYVTGGTDPTATKLMHIAKYLGVSVDWLLGLTDDLKPKKEAKEPIEAEKRKAEPHVRKVIISTQNMSERQLELLVRSYTGLSKEAVRGLHNSRAIPFKWQGDDK